MRRWCRAGVAASILTAGIVVTAPISVPAGAQSDAATFILRNLAGGAIGSIGARAMGQIVSLFGQGDALQGQIASINAQLGQLNGAINNLASQVAQLNETLHQVACDTNSNAVANIVSRTQHVLGIVDALSALPVSDAAGRESLAEEFDHEVRPLIPEQQALQNGLMGSGSGQGVLRACARALQAQTAPFLVTTQLRPKVEQLIQYYRTIQAALIMLRVNYWSAHKRPQSYIDTEVRQTDGWISQQQRFVKPTLFPGLDAFIDTRTGLVWRTNIHQLDASNFHIIGSRTPFTIDYVNGWGYPTLAQVQNLYQGAPNPAGPWFINRAGMQFSGVPGRLPLGPIANPTGCIWTSTTSDWRTADGPHGLHYLVANVGNGAAIRLAVKNGGGRFVNSSVCFSWLVAPPIPNWESMYSYG